MPQAIVWMFLLLSSLFALAHNFAVVTSLYWYYFWFDIVMHFWGGILIVLGIFSLCTFRHITFKPTAVLVFSILALIIILWELFEVWVGLFDPVTFVYDVGKDILAGGLGGLVGYLLMIRLRI